MKLLSNKSNIVYICSIISIYIHAFIKCKYSQLILMYKHKHEMQTFESRQAKGHQERNQLVQHQCSIKIKGNLSKCEYLISHMQNSNKIKI